MSHANHEQSSSFPEFGDFYQDLSKQQPVALDLLSDAVVAAVIGLGADVDVSDMDTQGRIAGIALESLFDKWGAIKGLPMVGDTIIAKGRFMYGVVPGPESDLSLDILTTDDGERLQGTLSQFAIGNYFDESYIDVDQDSDDFDDLQYYRPFGLHMVLSDAFTINADGVATFLDEPVQLTMQYTYESLQMTQHS
ncbi:MAG: hypothetical protein EON54_06465 [Alcaligenaceae bacterium]|nr:MAG: hypothetical protein EON54_06465 [Alcaligenaceae bacterium]